MKVENMTNRQGKKVKNQFLITDDNGDVYFQSYQTVIVRRCGGEVILDRNWDNSATTNKYRCQFLGENKAETVRKIKACIYTIQNLNS